MNVRGYGLRLLVLSLIVVLVCTVIRVDAQSAFRASQGLAPATTVVKSSLPHPGLTSIATLGDTTFFSQYLPAGVKGLLQFSFDPSKGESSFWGYRFHESINATDSTASAIVLKILGTYQGFSTAMPEIPSLPVSLSEDLPSSFMDSDTMASRITESAEYQSYIAQHPKAKWQAIALGMSQGGGLPTGPVWIATIGDQVANPSLQCYVPAADNTGDAVCIESAGMGVSNETISSGKPSLYPNPAAGENVKVHVPLESYTGSCSIMVYSALGQLVASKHCDHIGGGVDVEVDVHALPQGAYFVQVHTSSADVVLPLLRSF